MRLKAYGSRGSLAFSHPQGVKTGGNTSCFCVEVNGHIIVLDCGSGIMGFHQDMLEERKGRAGSDTGRGEEGMTFDLLISHLHLDHIIGLSLFDFLFDPMNTVRIFTRSRADSPLADQVFGIFKPPYWPIDLSKYNQAELVEIKGGDILPLAQGVTVSVFDSMHDNATSGFRIEGDKSAVYLLDYEIGSDGEQFASLAEFCKDADVVVFDATYLPEDYPPRQGWGHSTYEDGMRLAEASGCRKMVFSHFFHIYTDETVDSIAKQAGSSGGGSTQYYTAYDGMELVI